MGIWCAIFRGRTIEMIGAAFICRPGTKMRPRIGYFIAAPARRSPRDAFRATPSARRLPRDAFRATLSARHDLRWAGGMLQWRANQTPLPSPSQSKPGLQRRGVGGRVSCGAWDLRLSSRWDQHVDRNGK